MANASYTAFRTGLMTGAYDLDTAVLKVALVTGYTYSAGHATMADVASAGGVVNGTPGALSNVTVNGGVVDADDCAVATTASGAPHVLIVFQASAVTGGADVPAAQQKLLWFFDTGTSLPITPGGGVVTISWPETAGKIYKLG